MEQHVDQPYIPVTVMQTDCPQYQRGMYANMKKWVARDYPNGLNAEQWDRLLDEQDVLQVI